MVHPVRSKLFSLREASRIAFISAWAVASLEMTVFLAKDTSRPFFTMHAPKGPPETDLRFLRASLMAKDMNFLFRAFCTLFSRHLKSSPLRLQKSCSADQDSRATFTKLTISALSFSSILTKHIPRRCAFFSMGVLERTSPMISIGP